MRHSRTPSTINAGSMADIAFLLLLFFLVSTTISQEKGIVRKLPEPCKTADCKTNIAERNMLRIHLNEKGALMIKEKLVPVAELKNIVKQFIDNNGNNGCSYCRGLQSADASVHPSKAVISISNHRLAPYQSYIAVQDQLTKAYKELRVRYAETTFKKDLDALEDFEIKETQKAYPFIVSEINVKE